MKIISKSPGKEARLLTIEVKEATDIPQECDKENVQVTREGRLLDLFEIRSVKYIVYLSARMYLVQKIFGGEILFLYNPKIFELVISLHNLKLLWSKLSILRR